MKVLVLFTLLISSAFAQQVIVAPAEVRDTQAQTVIQPAPLEMDIPLPAQREPLKQSVPVIEKVEKIYSQIKDSQFFVEFNPLRVSGGMADFESDEVTVQGNRALELEWNHFNFKLMPLDFKFGFENEGWGSFAQVLIQDGEENSELAVYAKVNGHKFGAGLILDISSTEAKVRSNNLLVAKGELKTTSVAPYFFASFSLVNDESMVIEQWNKIGGGYERAEDDDTTIKGVSFVFHPGLDFMFKINSKLLIGSGIEFEYKRFAGDMKASGVSMFRGVGNTFSYELNLIKTRFLF